METIKTLNIILDLIFKTVGAMFFIAVTLRYIVKVREIRNYNKKILEKKHELDTINQGPYAKRILGTGQVNQKQFEMMMEKHKKPIQDDYDTMKMERQFIVDELPLLNLVKA